MQAQGSAQAGMDTELLIVTVVKALVELAGFFLLGQGLLYLLAGKKREQNLAYQILCVLTGPVTRLVRRITPKAVVDRHIPLVAFLILFWIWVLMSWAKGQICSAVENRCESDASPAATAEFGVENARRHDALADAIATGQVFQVLQHHALHIGLRSIGDLIAVARGQEWLARHRN